jgi:hypothetical protein
MTIKEKSIVKIGKKRHFEIKLFAVKQERTIYEVVDTACKQYLEKESKKGVEKK